MTTRVQVPTTPVSPPPVGTVKGHYVWSAVGYWECRYCEHELGCGHERDCLVRELDDANRWGGDQTNRLRESRYQTERAIATVRGYFEQRPDEAKGEAWHMLAYKAESAGSQVVAVDPRNTSRACAECGAVDARSRRGEFFACVACGHTDDADVNAARNILARAERSGANGEQVVPVA